LDSVAAAFAEVVDVRLINLEVVVRHKGKVAEGLEVEDFRVLVDGKEVPIEFFSPIGQGKALGREGEELALPGVAPGQAVGNRYLVFIDDFYCIPSHRNRLLRKFEQQLVRLGPDDRMALVAFDGDLLQVLSPWSDSTAKLKAALTRASERPAHGLRTLTQERNRLGSGRSRSGFRSSFSGIGFSGRRAGLVDPATDGVAKQNISRVSRAAAAAMRGFANTDGRKVMILLSGGWPIGRTDWQSASGPRVFGGFYAGQRLLDPIIETANRLGFTLYPVDVLGQQAESDLAAIQTIQGLSLRRGLAREEEFRLKDSLQHLARATGGKAMFEAQSLRALEHISRDSKTYYWLAFSPDWHQDGKKRRIEVKVLRQGHRARYRRGFSDLPRIDEVGMQMEAALRFGVKMPQDGSLVLRPGAAQKAGLGKIRLPLHLSLSWSQLSLPETQVSTSGGQRFSLLVAAMDGRGGISNIPVTLPELGPPKPGEESVEHSIDLLLRREKHRILVVLYDTLSGEIFSASGEIDP
jgi:VWFA-related protein